MKEITLQVNGREMTFSEQELINILEEHFPNSTTAKVAKKPTEGEWFEVKPQDIDQKLFEKKRRDIKQEEIRTLILEAFSEIKNNPKKYGKNFKTMIPRKTWKSHISIPDLKKMACKLGDHYADWVEQSLEWAQRIANGESWESLCDDKDTSNWYRLVKWNDGYDRLIGGSVKNKHFYSATYVEYLAYGGFYTLDYTVPLVVSYEE